MRLFPYHPDPLWWKCDHPNCPLLIPVSEIVTKCVEHTTQSSSASQDESANNSPLQASVATDKR